MSRKTKPSRRAPSRPARQLHQANVYDEPRVQEPLPLICGACSALGRYSVGTVTLNPDVVALLDLDRIDDVVGFTGYFRCRKCDAGGPWELPDNTLAYISLMISAIACGRADVPLVYGCTATFDKKIFRYATDAEAHLKELIDDEPERSFLWVRLGNLYSHAGASERAEPAYRRAIEIDPKDIEAHSMLGQLLFDSDQFLESVPCFHAVLKHVRDAQEVDNKLRRNLARKAIEFLLAAHAESNGQFELLPAPDPEKLQRGPDGEPAVVELVEIDLGSEEGLDDLCDMFLGKRHDGWRSRFRRPKRREFDASDDWLTPPMIRTQPAVGRNAPCPCGSRHKYKKCCWRRTPGSWAS